jgi:hypothetical protein
MAIGAFDSDAFDAQLFSEDAFLFEEAGVVVPDVVGQSQAAGVAALEGDGFVVAVVTANSATVPAGDIISQSPAAGIEAASGSTVTITVSLGDDDDGFYEAYADARRRRREAQKPLLPTEIRELSESEIAAILLWMM